MLLIPGAETNGFLAFPRQSVQNQKTDTPQAFSDLVRSTGGQIFLCHLEERMDWDIANITGTEIYNTHADFKEEARFVAALRSPLTMFGLMDAVKQYPQEVFGALLDYPADYLKRYDQLCQKARHTGVAGNDSHHNQAYRARIVEGGKVLVENALGEELALLDPEKLAAGQAADRRQETRRRDFRSRSGSVCTQLSPCEHPPVTRRSQRGGGAAGT